MMLNMMTNPFKMIRTGCFLKTMCRFIHRRAPLCAVSGALLVLTGCVSVLPETAPPAPRYTIGAATPTVTRDMPVSWSLAIADPSSSQLYNTVKVPITREKNRFEFFAGTEWVDRVPVLFQRALVRSFENTDQIVNVGDFSALPVGDYVLKTDIRAFHADYTQADQIAQVQIFARLSLPDGTIAASRVFDASSVSADATLSSTMAAFDTGLDTVLGEIVQWTFEQVDAITAAADRRS